MKLRRLFMFILMMATTSSAAHAATSSKSSSSSSSSSAKKTYGSKASHQLSASNRTSRSNRNLVKKPPMQTGAKLSTDMHFDELGVHGRYQAGDEGYAVVEDEKALDDLLDYRKDYKDRLKKSRFQR